jgi:hypothetical protein
VGKPNQGPGNGWSWAIGLLVLLTLAAGVLRAVGLNSQLWCDEIVLVVNAIRVPARTLLTSYFWDNQHTLYALSAQGCVAIFGDYPWSARLPAILCGTAAVPALYLLGRELTDRFEALAAAALLAVSYHHIWFSQNARGYTALMLAAVLATWCLVRGLKRPGWGPWLAYATVVALGMYVHLTMLFVAVSHALVCGWLILVSGRTFEWRTDWRRPAAAFTLAAVLTLLLYAPMLGDVAYFFLHKPTGMKAISTPRWALAEAWTVLQKGLGGKPGLAIPVLLSGGLVLGCGLWSYLRQDLVSLLLLVLPIAITFGGALAGRGTMYPRFFFYLLGFGLLVVARGIAVLSREVTGRLPLPALQRHPQFVAASLVLLLMAFSVASLGANYRYPKQDFAGALAFVEAHRVNGDPVVTAGDPATFCYQRYYNQPWIEVRDVEQLQAVLGGGRPVWLVYTMPQYLDLGKPALAAQIRESFRVVREFPGTLNGGAVLVCCAEPTSGGRQQP